LSNPEKREDALTELSKKKETFPNLALYLWNSVGTIAIL
jgi:CCR4-NOT transcription complex subunit 9